jgi:citrate synthase
MFPVLTAVPRTAGFIAHWQESLDDSEYKIYRPRQVRLFPASTDFIIFSIICMIDICRNSQKNY